MIRLKSLLQEITFGGITPYVTQFTWSTLHVMGATYYTSKFNADGHGIDMTMSPLQNDSGEYIFVYTTLDKWGTQSYSHNSSVARGQLDYLRLIRTVAEAILDFCAQHAPEAIDISGGDGDPAMKQKKNRIYSAFLQSNASRLEQAGYRTLMRRDNIWIVRKQAYDATGIEND